MTALSAGTSRPGTSEPFSTSFPTILAMPAFSLIAGSGPSLGRPALDWRDRIGKLQRREQTWRRRVRSTRQGFVWLAAGSTTRQIVLSDFFVHSTEHVCRGFRAAWNKHNRFRLIRTLRLGFRVPPTTSQSHTAVRTSSSPPPAPSCRRDRTAAQLPRHRRPKCSIRREGGPFPVPRGW